MNKSFQITFTPKPRTYAVDAKDEYTALATVLRWFDKENHKDLLDDLEISIEEKSPPF